MKKGQATVEYVTFLAIMTLIFVLIGGILNRNAIINGGIGGVEDQNGVVHIRPMTD